MGYHAVKAPSSAYRWTDCTASIKQSVGCPNNSSEAARVGTCCHQISEEVLVDPKLDLQDYLGRVMAFWTDVFGKSGEDWDHGEEHYKQQLQVVYARVEVTQRMIDAVASYVAFVRQQQEIHGAEALIEQRVPIGHFTHEEGAGGTSDCIILAIEQDTIICIDAKFGIWPVHASDLIAPAGLDPFDSKPTPEIRQMNLQAACYLLGALHEHGYLHEFKYAKAVIVQPFLKHVSEYTCSIEELMRLQVFISDKARECDENPVFKPSSDNCKFCPAGQAGKCPERDRAAHEAALAGFTDETMSELKPVTADYQLGAMYDKIGLIESYLESLKAKVFEELRAGRPVVRPDGLRYKLVPGRKGDRKWKDEKAVEEQFKRMRLKRSEMYDFHLISPVTAEKLSKPTRRKGQPPLPPLIGPNQWELLEANITQADGKPTIALETDPKPEVPHALTGFEDVEPDPFTD